MLLYPRHLCRTRYNTCYTQLIHTLIHTQNQADENASLVFLAALNLSSSNENVIFVATSIGIIATAKALRHSRKLGRAQASVRVRARFASALQRVQTPLAPR
jgi:hypothetical protein